MLTVNLERWHHSPDGLRGEALKANHPRPRERLLALYEITQGKHATQVGPQGRKPQTIMDWVHGYNAGYGWGIRGERFWVSCSSPGRAKVSFYGVYLGNRAQVRVFAYDKADQFKTIDLLTRLRVEFPNIPFKGIWDGASYRHSRCNQLRQR